MILRRGENIYPEEMEEFLFDEPGNQKIAKIKISFSINPVLYYNI